MFWFLLYNPELQWRTTIFYEQFWICVSQIKLTAGGDLILLLFFLVSSNPDLQWRRDVFDEQFWSSFYKIRLTTGGDVFFSLRTNDDERSSCSGDSTFFYSRFAVIFWIWLSGLGSLLKSDDFEE